MIFFFSFKDIFPLWLSQLSTKRLRKDRGVDTLGRESRDNLAAGQLLRKSAARPAHPGDAGAAHSPAAGHSPPRGGVSSGERAGVPGAPAPAPAPAGAGAGEAGGRALLVASG